MSCWERGGPGRNPDRAVVELAYQTGRQREARRTDFQRTTLIQIRDLLLELSEAMGKVGAARYMDADVFDGMPTDHPTVVAVRSIIDRLVIVAAAVEDDQLRIHVDQVARRAHLDAIAPTDEVSEKARAKSLEIHRKAVQLLGEQLRRLP